MGHGRALITLDSLEQQLDTYQRILSDHLSVRETEKLVKVIKGGKLTQQQTKTNTLPEYVTQHTKDLNTLLDTKVSTTMSSTGKGKITISYASKADFERIVKLINES
jgi:ParB family chromosome partitioning protein